MPDTTFPTVQNRRLPLVVIATAQLMLVLDDTIANIALPSIQREFDVAAATLPWIISAYVLAFGSLLLLGGRVGDVYGRRRVLRLGLALFVLASMLGGLGVNETMLIAARGLQGAGAALVAPNVLALIATTFTQGKERNGAMAVYAAMSAVGMTVGILLGGLLTGYLSWRWVFLINVPLGLMVLAGTRVLPEGERFPGALHALDGAMGTAAMFALAFGITRGGEHGWGDALALAACAVFAVLAVLFFLSQRRRVHPMLPLGLFANRNRTGSYAAVLFIGGGLMATYYLLTLFMQQVLEFSPVMSGLASLPVSVGIVLAAGASAKLVERFPPRLVAAPGLLMAAAGLYLLSRLSVESSYFGHILPALFITYFGLGLGFMPLTLTAVEDTGESEAGVASAMLNTAQQIGAALGVALLGSIATMVAHRVLPHAPLQGGAALAAGYTTAFLAGAGMLVIAAAIVALVVNTARTQSAAIS